MSSWCLWTMQNVMIAIVQNTSVLRRECSTWTTWTTFSCWKYQQRVAMWTPCFTNYMCSEAARTWTPGLQIDGYTATVLQVDHVDKVLQRRRARHSRCRGPRRTWVTHLGRGSTTLIALAADVIKQAARILHFTSSL